MDTSEINDEYLNSEFVSNHKYKRYISHHFRYDIK